MTDPMPTNGRVTQRDLYDAISRIDTKLDRHYLQFDERLRHVEKCIVEEQAHDDERALMIREQREMKREQGISKRWMVTLAIGIFTSLALAFAPYVENLLA